MSKFKFKNQVNTIIEWYNQGKSYAEIARLLQSTNVEKDAGCIRRLLRSKLGDIHGNPNIVITEEVKQQIQHYLNNGKTPKQISTILKLKEPTVASYIRNLGLKFRPDPGNIHYFENIDTYAKAYILGFIAADGALVPAKKGPTITLTITIKYEDKALLEFIKSEIGNTHKLLEIRRPSSFNQSKEIHHIRLAMSTPTLVHDIMKYGITPRKSLTLDNIIPNIPYEFRDAFILGYFDGNGSVGINNNPNSDTLYIQIRAAKRFLEGVCDHLQISKSHIYERDSIPQLCFANQKDVYRLYQCYNNLPFYYKRKHDKFLLKINNASYDKYKQDQTISSSTE